MIIQCIYQPVIQYFDILGHDKQRLRQISMHRVLDHIPLLPFHEYHPLMVKWDMLACQPIVGLLSYSHLY